MSDQLRVVFPVEILDRPGTVSAVILERYPASDGADEVLQVEDIKIVESVQKGMNTPAFTQGRIVNDPDGSGQSEHAVHHFHGLVLDAYAKTAA